MRDKVLCKGWVTQCEPRTENPTPPLGEACFTAFISYFAFLPRHSVPVSIQGGAKMSIDEFLSFFDCNLAWRDQKTRKEYSEQISRKELDTILAADSLFRGTVVDFSNSDSSFRGGNYATYDFAVN